MYSFTIIKYLEKKFILLKLKKNDLRLRLLK